MNNDYNVKFVRIDNQSNIQILTNLHKNKIRIIEYFLQNRICTNIYRGVKTHMALIVRYGKIIASACNKFGNRSLGCGYSNRTIHAEKNVVKTLGNIYELRDCDMYIIRTGVGVSDTTFYDSKPCCECVRFLEKCRREYGLRNIYYTSSGQYQN